MGFQLVENTKGQVWGLNELHDKLFLGHSEGAFIIENDIAKQIHPDIGTWMFLPFQGNKEKVFSGTYYGINLLEKSNGEWKLEKKMDGLEESSRILARSSNGDYWMAHPYRGIFRIQINAKKDNIKAATFYGKENGLPTDIQNYVFSVFNKILATTANGIYFYNEN